MLQKPEGKKFWGGPREFEAMMLQKISRFFKCEDGEADREAWNKTRRPKFNLSSEAEN